MGYGFIIIDGCFYYHFIIVLTQRAEVDERNREKKRRQGEVRRQVVEGPETISEHNEKKREK